MRNPRLLFPSKSYSKTLLSIEDLRIMAFGSENNGVSPENKSRHSRAKQCSILFVYDILKVFSQQNGQTKSYSKIPFYRSSENNGVWRSADYHRKLTLDIREPNNVLFSSYMTFCERFSPSRMDRRERNGERGCIS
ncbi:hypothetical protein CEXT_509231 [Caerostris extrusa]|uniref:Uncharacterized protein n=1 Tax=Caerostris extrusa TaxID=172846 RepID=A0AAV4W1M9_CAEEX|nr:hypothetical protein CEXT_509231 [Caerostris extrusa]